MMVASNARNLIEYSWIVNRACDATSCESEGDLVWIWSHSVPKLHNYPAGPAMKKDEKGTFFGARHSWLRACGYRSVERQRYKADFWIWHSKQSCTGNPGCSTQLAWGRQPESQVRLYMLCKKGASWCLVARPPQMLISLKTRRKKKG